MLSLHPHDTTSKMTKFHKGPQLLHSAHFGLNSEAKNRISFENHCKIFRSSFKQNNEGQYKNLMQNYGFPSNLASRQIVLHCCVKCL